MLSRMWTAESEKTVTAALIDEYAAAATTAVGTEKRELEDERKGLEVTMKGVEDSSAAAQAILYEGGNGDLMKQVSRRPLGVVRDLALRGRHGQGLPRPQGAGASRPSYP